MKAERMILIAFFGNYLINNVVAGLASLVPPTQGATTIWTPQYITFVVLGAVVLGLMTWWYLMKMPTRSLMQGLIFGVAGFVVAVVTALLTGICGVLLQTGSFAQVMAVLPNFGPYLMSWTTLVLAGMWVVPGIAVGWMMQSKMGGAPATQAMPRPMI